MDLFKYAITWKVLAVVAVLAMITGFTLGNPERAYMLFVYLYGEFWNFLIYMLILKLITSGIDSWLGFDENGSKNK